MAEELGHLPGFFFLDSSSAEAGSSLDPRARFSLITARPRMVVEGNLSHEADFERLRTLLDSSRRPEGSTPDYGFPEEGLYGYIGYEGHFVFGEYRDFLLYDHAQGLWKEKGGLSSLRRPRRFPGSKVPRVSIRFCDEMDEERFCDLVKTAQEYIAAGDIYQVNLSHRLAAPVPEPFEPLELYRHLREQSPAPFAGFTNLGGRRIFSSSPEQFLTISGRTIQTRPIKGTRPRFRELDKDEKSAYDLITSPKEVAELVMITDLERNDLGQICEYGSVAATELLKLERFAQVFHLVSTVEGTLRSEVGHLEAVRACFPGGSITGAPKKRAREIIRELEGPPRGIYTGIFGCFGFNGESRFNIAIRTLVEEEGLLHFHVGAGIVADSVAEKEWEETLHKAAGIFRACERYAPASD